MNKKVVIVSHRGLLSLDRMESHFSESLKSFFTSSFTQEKAPPSVFLTQAKKLVKEFDIDTNMLKIGDDWDLDTIYVNLYLMIEEDQQKINELTKWYEGMNNYSASEIDNSSLCEDLFDDHLEKNQMTVKNRCSVWKHKESNDDFAFYAVFPLRSANKDWPQTLINAVKEINQNPIEEILLLLHDHDLYNNYTPFHLDDSLSKSLSNCNEQKITLAVFQHINKEMSFLVNEQHSPKEIFNHYSEILGEKQKILDASSNDIVYKGYLKKLKKNIIDDNQ